mmetsp:Transcript_8917/g.16076  ORF Transcript_8917/g.16076 Transcript_8917/m.16076 type:complete len:249 (-) Transcript_8917:1058-1804(-)
MASFCNTCRSTPQKTPRSAFRQKKDIQAPMRILLNEADDEVDKENCMTTNGFQTPEKKTPDIRKFPDREAAAMTNYKTSTIRKRAQESNRAQVQYSPSQKRMLVNEFRSQKATGITSSPLRHEVVAERESPNRRLSVYDRELCSALASNEASVERGSVITYSQIRANRIQRSELGVDSLLSPVRHCTRTQSAKRDPKASISQLLNESGFAYSPNPALDNTHFSKPDNVSSTTKYKSSENTRKLLEFDI